ncbi:phage portal protein [Chitinophaga varians]|uniref:phage portal protein n=1 Tax=Chitinophaga varians TaxID=2202339 RepID=UPI00165FF933|nr:phage portal protein [Chitinophaga varians]MBC9913177.1 phage portal protein [Chitinophaga varians]
MELVDLQALIGTYDELIKKVQAAKPVKKVPIADALKQLDPTQHPVTDKSLRQDKSKQVNGQTTPVFVARLPIPMQKKIVNLAAAFLCANPIQLSAQTIDDTQKGLLAGIKKLWDDNKLDYESMGEAELMMAETEVAELWYVVDAPEEYWIGTPSEGSKLRLRMRILANSLGDQLNPVFDATGDMIAFGRGYSIKNGDNNEEHFDLYTDTQIIKGVKQSSGWVTTSENNMIGKIPVIYYSQPLPEWSDVEALIERLETNVSNNADTNDYFGSPIVFVEGEIQGFADKGESGKVLQAKAGAKASYLTWDHAPEIIRYESDTLQRLIYSMTDTPNISFEEMKGLSTFSGAALRMLFLGAHLKAARKEGIFGKGIQRRINFMKTAMSIIDVRLQPALSLSIKPVFEYYLPKNIQEIIQTLSEGVGAGKPVMSQKTAVRNNPLVADADQEFVLMQEEGALTSDVQTA